MAIQIQGQSGVVSEVGGTTFRGAHVHNKPLEYAALGHYRTAVRISSTAVQAAASRLFQIRNTHVSNLIIPTRLTLRAWQTGAATAILENSLDVYKLTGFTAVDTTNTVTPVSSVRRTGTMAAYPGGAAIRYLTITGAAAGMTGGTLTKDAQFFATLPYSVQIAAPVGTNANFWGPYDSLDDVNGTHPFALAQNEGIGIESRVVGGAAFAVAWYIDFSWAEVAAY